MDFSENESCTSIDEPPSDYEKMLQKYEAEVRNHIKIEQQLKLHIECVQDKLEETEKLMKKQTVEQDSANNASMQAVQDLTRYKDALALREKEIEQMKASASQWRKAESDLKAKLAAAEKDLKLLKENLMQAKQKIS
jgi:chromosome segregation ATPase